MTKPGGRKVGGTVLILAGLAAALLFSSCGASPAAARRELPALVISEVVSSNRESLPVDALGAPDWIELQNIGDTALELEGYGLSDRTTEPGKYIFGKETLEPGQTIVVYAKQVESLHAPFARRCTGFALSKDGETLCLTAPDRTTIQTLTLPALAADVSYARKTDGDYGYCGVPTPGEPNDDAAILSSLDEAKRVRNERESTPLPAMEGGTPYASTRSCSETAIPRRTRTATAARGSSCTTARRTNCRLRAIICPIRRTSPIAGPFRTQRSGRANTLSCSCREKTARMQSCIRISACPKRTACCS